MVLPARIRRGFKLVDAMALTASFALAFMFWRHLRKAYDARTASVYKLVPGKGLKPVLTYLLLGFDVAAPFLLAFSVALTLLRWVPPRDHTRRVVRQPGFVASAVLSGTTAGIFFSWLLLYLPSIWKYLVEIFHDRVADDLPSINIYDASFRTVLFMTLAGGVGVAVSWIGLAVTGGWEPESDWIERWGRVLGILAIALVPFLVWASLITS